MNLTGASATASNKFLPAGSTPDAQTRTFGTSKVDANGPETFANSRATGFQAESKFDTTSSDKTNGITTSASTNGVTTVLPELDPEAFGTASSSGGGNVNPLPFSIATGETSAR